MVYYIWVDNGVVSPEHKVFSGYVEGTPASRHAKAIRDPDKDIVLELLRQYETLRKPLGVRDLENSDVPVY